MQIGILSDTHGNVTRTATAATLLKVHGAEIVFHCGDIGSEQVLIELGEVLGMSGVPVHAVLGNVDLEDPRLTEFPSTFGVHVHGLFLDKEVGGKRIAVLHGHEAERLEAAIASQRFDYVFTGHTHTPEDQRDEWTRVINPGAVHRTRGPLVAVLDTETNTLRYIALRDDVIT